MYRALPAAATLIFTPPCEGLRPPGSRLKREASPSERRVSTSPEPLATVCQPGELPGQATAPAIWRLSGRYCRPVAMSTASAPPAVNSSNCPRHSQQWVSRPTPTVPTPPTLSRLASLSRLS